MCKCMKVVALLASVAWVQAQDATITLSQTDTGVDINVGGSISDVSAISGTFVRRRRNQETRPVLRLGAPSQFIVTPFDNLAFNLLSPTAMDVALDATGCGNFPPTSTTFLINATDPDDPAPILGVFDAVPPSLHIVTISDTIADHIYDWSGTIFGESFSTMGILEGTTCSLRWTGSSGIPQTISLVAETISIQPPTLAPSGSLQPAPPVRFGFVATALLLAEGAWDLLRWAFEQLGKALRYIKHLFSSRDQL